MTSYLVSEWVGDVLEEFRKWDVMDRWDWSQAEFPNCYEHVNEFENFKGKPSITEFVTEYAERTQYSTKLPYDHTKIKEAIEIVIKMLDMYDHFDRVFAEE